MPKERLRLVSSTNFVGKKKRNLQNYFDTNPPEVFTPTHSLPKRKALFKHKSKGKNLQKQSYSRKNSTQKRQRKIEFSPPHNRLKSQKKSAHKNSRLEHSHYRQYDSPARQQEDMDLILAGHHTRKQKGNNYVNGIIDRVNDNLKHNHVEQAVETLREALQEHPANFDLNYLLGICHLINASFQAAVQVFQRLLKTQPRKNIYLLLSVCYKKAENFELTQSILDLCLEKYPKYYEAYIYRGKLFLKLKNYKKAYLDFQKAMNLDTHKQMGLIGKGDCLRLMEKYEEARALYIQALKQSGSQLSSLLLRKAICAIELKKYDTALEDINRILEADPSNSQALYFKGLVLSKQSNVISKAENTNEALICYQQAIKHNSNKKAVTRALYEITKLKIQNRDFYQALYTLERAQFLDIDERVVKKFRVFIQGATSMMKKNYSQGIRILTELANDSDKPMSNFLKPLFYSCRSYGYMSLQKFVLAKEDLDTLERQFALDLPNLYNKFICEGILACNSVKYEQALAYFSKAGKAQPHRVEPSFYKAVTLICFAHKLLPREMSEKKIQYIESAMKTIEKTSLPIENNPSLFLVRGFLHYALGNLESALEDFEGCLNESIKPNPLVFYLNGLVLAQAGKYNEAIHEFKRVIEGDEKHKLSEVYLKRAQCMILMGDINNGFQDLQSYMTHQPTSPDIHIWAGHLLFHIGACQDAAKAYSNLNNITKNPEVLEYRAKCYLTSKDVISTVNDLRQLLELNYSNAIYFDCEMLETLRECSEENFEDYAVMLKRAKSAKSKVKKTGELAKTLGKIFGWAEYQFYKGVLYFYSGDYQAASKNFKRAQQIMQQRIEEEVKVDERLIEYFKNTFHHVAFNFFQIRYNIALAEIMAGNLAKASRYLKEVAKSAAQQGQQELRNEMELLISLISQQMLKKFQNPQNAQQPNQKNAAEDQAQFLPFPSQNRLCSIFPDFVLPFSQSVRTKLFFCLPYVPKPDISVKFELKVLEHFDMSVIETKPEAPWIRRSEEGVIFTDQVVRYDIELSESSQSSQSREEESNFQEERQDHSDGGCREEEQSIQFNPRKLREMLELDPATKERLSKIK